MYVVERVVSARSHEEFLAAGAPDGGLLARRLDPREPFWPHATRALFLLRDATTRRVCGRVGAVVNTAYDEIPGPADRAGFFAWLACPDDTDAARALFEAAGQWLRERGREVIRGPLHLGLGEELGALVEGFDRAPGPLTPWNAPYQSGLLERIGVAGVQERHAYAWSRDEMPPPPASLRVGEDRSARSGVVYRALEPNARDREATRFLATYNAALAGRWGFVPLTEAEAQARLRDIMTFGDPRLVWLAEVNGAPAGIVISMPSTITAAGDSAPVRASGSVLRSSRLGPLRALREALAGRRIDRAHLVAIAVEPRYRGLHLGAQLLLRTWRAALDLGVREAELSGVDPADDVMHQMLWRFGCRRVRRFRVHERRLR